MKRFYVKDCPENLAVYDWISKETDMQTAVRDVGQHSLGKDLIDIPHRLDIAQIKSATIDALGKFGVHGWQTQRGESRAYGGLSMVYNPDLRESVDPNQNTLGTTTNRPDEFFYASTGRFDSVRNTYFDSYGFRKLAPCIAETALKEFVQGFNLSLTRSRIAVLDADYHDRVGEDFLWHKDETIFENLRLNIPIETDESFLFQIEGQSPQHLKVGNIYTWDTHLSHRVYATEKKSKARIHLVLGFSPWFDYYQGDDSFSVNKFFGKTHPIDIYLQGLAHPLIGNRYD
jgi:hypothetical protein